MPDVGFEDVYPSEEGTLVVARASAHKTACSLIDGELEGISVPSVGGQCLREQEGVSVAFDAEPKTMLTGCTS